VPENPAAQYNGLLGGNANVQPEKSDTLSFGVLFQPPFVSNLFVSLDYFDIDIEDTISDLAGGNADAYINQCLATGDPAFCSRIHRDAFGSLWLTPTGFITDTSDNIARLGAKGIDLQASYRVDLGPHRLAFNLVGTRLEKAEKELVKGVGAFDCAGLFGGTCGVPNAKWRHSLRTTWQTPWRGLDVSMTWRFVDSVDLETTSANPQLAGDVPLTDAHFGSRSYIDLTGAVKFFENYTLRIGANNLLDKDPPLVGQDNCPAGTCNGNTFSQAYDVLGRQWFATVTVDF
jgi:iron complex outermembrane recepter protein